MSEALVEYQSQLAEVEELLEADTNDESLLQLKADLLLLIQETQSHDESQGASNEENTAGHNAALLITKDMVEPPSPENNSSIALTAAVHAGVTTEEQEETKQNSKNDDSYNAESCNKDTNKSEKKKSSKKSKATKVPSTFEIPTHLVPLESDTEAERNRKRRAIKTLKSKWRERVKESTTTQKQKSWHDFMGKTKKKRKPGVSNTSIFQTEDGVNARVGVIGSGKSMTQFGERKRFKM